jgi:hypothetical protein
MSTTIKEGDAVAVSMSGDIVEVAFHDVTWRIRVKLDADAVILSDPTTGEPLHQGEISNIGITRTDTRYHPEKSDREKMIMGFVVAWIMLEPRH